jgi:DNA-binding transcriptional regulator LsrR (DeoR family)
MAQRSVDKLIHKAAWLYYTHGLRQDEVAHRLGISRASVTLYLRRAREAGIVNITTSTELFRDDRAARQIEDAFGLETVWIVGNDGLAPDPVTQVPSVAAGVFLEMVESGDRIAVAWGRTVYAMADAMAFADRQGVTVVEMCGNLGSPYEYRPDQCIMEIARRLNARGLNFYAPLVLRTAALAEELRQEPVIREQLESISGCSLALFSIGTINEDSHVIKCGALGLSELADLKALGATGVIAGQIIDADGALLPCDYNRRMISADFDAIRAIPRRLVVVQEDDKFEPLKAALKGGFATHLVVTSDMARKLLASIPDAPSNAPADIEA